jgi:hypothetical protein
VTTKRNADYAGKRILLDNLPKLLKGYIKTFVGYKNYWAVEAIVCDLDNKNKP